ncbi:MAG: hypothetical protein ACHQ1H_00400 [Nitrososphaerales archaeon]
MAHTGWVLVAQGVPMEVVREKHSRWIWTGGISTLLFMFAGARDSTGIFFIFAMMPFAAAILLAIGLLKIILRFASNKTRDLTRHIAGAFHSNEIGRSVRQSRAEEHFYSAKSHSI